MLLSYRFKLDILARNLSHRAERVRTVVEIGDVQEAGLFKSYIDERRLHPGQHPRYLALIDVADQPGTGVALQVKLRQLAVFDQRYTHFERGGIDYDFTFHGTAIKADSGRLRPEQTGNAR